VGQNPTERGTLGTKRRVLTDGRLPLGIAVGGANRHEMKWVDATLEAIIIKRPEPMATPPQHLCLDQGTTMTPCARPSKPGATPLTFGTAAKKRRPSVTSRTTGHGIGWWSARTPG
jgi:hypothetical protein